MKNKILKYLSVLMFSIGMPIVCSCSPKSSGKIEIVSTIFPEYDWVENIIGDKKDNFNTTLLLNSGVDLHSYQPSPQDIVTISQCDLFIYVGGESDE